MLRGLPTVVRRLTPGAAAVLLLAACTTKPGAAAPQERPAPECVTGTLQYTWDSAEDGDEDGGPVPITGPVRASDWEPVAGGAGGGAAGDGDHRRRGALRRLCRRRPAGRCDPALPGVLARAVAGGRRRGRPGAHVQRRRHRRGHGHGRRSAQGRGSVEDRRHRRRACTPIAAPARPAGPRGRRAPRTARRSGLRVGGRPQGRRLLRHWREQLPDPGRRGRRLAAHHRPRGRALVAVASSTASTSRRCRTAPRTSSTRSPRAACAWTEGFADAVAAYVLGDDVYVHDDGLVQSFASTPDLPVADGDAVEGNVAASLLGLWELDGGWEDDLALMTREPSGDFAEYVTEDRPAAGLPLDADVRALLGEHTIDY
ncbi:hypothetical protein G5V59_16630 [Nocardioides sp. W3-2-3]|uniref:hypothetical protein n=1 Tax=Nocardioides convexus TaxID=2712224 RepID=UPI0024189D51|nr:hypothetical protein [Nocardioides convexus]NHA00971.1 hypothetical protein [Nocardioides convexus]